MNAALVVWAIHIQEAHLRSVQTLYLQNLPALPHTLKDCVC